MERNGHSAALVSLEKISAHLCHSGNARSRSPGVLNAQFPISHAVIFSMKRSISSRNQHAARSDESCGVRLPLPTSLRAACSLPLRVGAQFGKGTGVLQAMVSALSVGVTAR